MLIKIKPKKPNRNPKLIKLWGIQKQSISINDIQIKRDKNNQLKNILKNKLEEELYKDGELFTKRTKSIAVNNSIKG